MPSAFPTPGWEAGSTTFRARGNEMSRYGTLRTWAEELGMPDAVALLEATLKEEKATDSALTTLAKSVVNVEAEHAL
jgi:ferritin-like metal-binding protein YciE